MGITAHTRGRHVATLTLVAAVTLLALTASSPAVAGTRELPSALSEIQLQPTSGPAGSTVHIRGHGFHNSGYCHSVVISFTDAQGTYNELGSSYFDHNGVFRTTENIPTGAAVGPGYIMARAVVLVGRQCMLWFGGGPTATFTVTQ